MCICEGFAVITAESMQNCVQALKTEWPVILLSLIKNQHSSIADITTRARDYFGIPLSSTTIQGYIQKCSLKHNRTKRNLMLTSKGSVDFSGLGSVCYWPHTVETCNHTHNSFSFQPFYSVKDKLCSSLTQHLVNVMARLVDISRKSNPHASEKGCFHKYVISELFVPVRVQDSSASTVQFALWKIPSHSLWVGQLGWNTFQFTAAAMSFSGH